MIHSSLRTLICVVACIFILILVNSCNVSTRGGWDGLTLVGVVGWRRAIEPTLTHVPASPLWCDLQSHVVEVLCEFWLCPNYDYVVISVLVGLESIAAIIIVVLRIVVALWLVLMTWLCLIYRFTEETLVRAVHCSRLRLHKRVLQGIAQVNARLADQLSWMEMLRSLMIQIQIRMLLPVKHLIGSWAIRITI